MKYRQLVVAALTASVTLGITVWLWRVPYLLAGLLFLIALGFMIFMRKKRFVAVYAFGFIFGPLTEAFAIRTGAWQYAMPSFFGIPVWLPFLWGCAALILAFPYTLFNEYGTH